MKVTLHLVSRSPFADQTLTQCLQVLKPQDSIVLLEDATWALKANQPWRQRLSQLSETHAIYVLAEDAALRGIAIDPPFLSVDYEKLVTLSCEHQHSMSWF